MTTRNRDLDDLHPTARAQFLQLTEVLARGYEAGETLTLFRLFEGYRSPEDQEREFFETSSKARAWQSAHQYGLACDFVPYDAARQWHWDETADWAYLKRKALSLGLDVPITWDKPHVQHPAWNTMKARIRAMRK